MTDLKIAEMCAKALGFQLAPGNEIPHIGKLICYGTYGKEFYFDPIKNGEHAFLLVKKFPKETAEAILMARSDECLGRVISNCVANLQLMK